MKKRPITFSCMQLTSIPAAPGEEAFIAPLSKIHYSYSWGLVSKYVFILLIWRSVFLPISCCLNYYHFIVPLEFEKVMSFIYILLRVTLAVYISLLFHKNFGRFWSICLKNVIGIFIQIKLNLYVALGSVAILRMLILQLQLCL